MLSTRSRWCPKVRKRSEKPYAMKLGTMRIRLALTAVLLVAAFAQETVPYNPILCGSVTECGCSGPGNVQCSPCPDDGGSPNVNNDVCWCSDLPFGGTGGQGNECNPLKLNGPQAAQPGGSEAAPAAPQAADSATCYGPGIRNQGPAGFPAVPYKPCCDGNAAAEKPGDWGKFCPSESGSNSAPASTDVAGNDCRRRRRRRRRRL